jgi:hypothetical protein
MGCAVVSLDGCGRLLVAHLFKEVSHGDCFTLRLAEWLEDVLRPMLAAYQNVSRFSSLLLKIGLILCFGKS